MSGNALKMADAPAPAAGMAGEAFYRRYGLRSRSASANDQTPVPEPQVRLAQYSQQSQFIGGKTFFQNDQQWVDSAVQKSANAKHVQLQFGSAEYFDFATNHPQAAAWLALGRNVQFVLDNTIYEIHE